MEPLPWNLLFSPRLPALIGFLLCLLGGLWILHLFIENASLADVGFCLGLVFLIGACGMAGEGVVWRRGLIAAMGSLYSLRLGWHLWFRRVWRKAEDARYGTIRRYLGAWEKVGFLGYFLLQVPACLFFGALFCWVMEEPSQALRWWDGVGIAVFCVSFIGEMVADRQLETFRSNPANQGKVLQTGLWRYSRHPNYFFETLHWCSYVPLAWGLPWAGVAVVWPGAMLMTLLWITGVPWAEAQAIAGRGESYRVYQSTTNRLLLWPPRRK